MGRTGSDGLVSVRLSGRSMMYSTVSGTTSWRSRSEFATSVRKHVATTDQIVSERAQGPRAKCSLEDLIKGAQAASAARSAE